jgi:hypothetical protein
LSAPALEADTLNAISQISEVGVLFRRQEYPPASGFLLFINCRAGGRSIKSKLGVCSDATMQYHVGCVHSYI